MVTVDVRRIPVDGPAGLNFGPVRQALEES